MAMELPTTNPNSTNQKIWILSIASISKWFRRTKKPAAPDNDVVIILPPDIPMPKDISKKLYKEFYGLEKQMNNLFESRKSFLDDCAKIVNILKDNILMVYGMGMLALLSCKDPSCKDGFKSAIMMMVIVWIGVIFPIVVAWMNLGLKMDECSHRALQKKKFQDDYISWATKVASDPGNGCPVSENMKKRVSSVKRGPELLSLDEHYTQIRKLALMSIAASFLIPVAVYILHCKGFGR